MLEWPSRAKKSIAAFFIKWNDIDVFVEDTAKYAKSVYCALINNALQGKAEVDTVIPLGNRDRVVQACAQDTKKGGRNRIYLIDGDLDLAAGLPAPALPRLYRHNVYHLENYLVCETGLLAVLHEENPRVDANDLAALFDYASWKVSIAPLEMLFAVFGVTRLLAPALPTISLGLHSFCSANQRLDQAKVLTFCNSRLADLEVQFGVQAVENAQVEVATAIGSMAHPFHAVSAREFMFPLLRVWVKDKGLKLKADSESLMLRLAKSCAIQNHPNFVSRLELAAKVA